MNVDIYVWLERQRADYLLIDLDIGSQEEKD